MTQLLEGIRVVDVTTDKAEMAGRVLSDPVGEIFAVTDRGQVQRGGHRQLGGIPRGVSAGPFVPTQALEQPLRLPFDLRHRRVHRGSQISGAGGGEQGTGGDADVQGDSDPSLARALLHFHVPLGAWEALQDVGYPGQRVLDHRPLFRA